MDMVPPLHLPAKPPARRWRKWFSRIFSATALSVGSMLIATTALLVSAYVAYQDIKPTLVVGTEFEYENDSNTDGSVSVYNSGRRTATDITLRVEVEGRCGPEEYSFGQLAPGYVAEPLFEKCPDNSDNDWVRVDVEYTWDLGWFSRSYSVSEVFYVDDYKAVNTRLL